MGIRDILVLVDASDLSEPRLRFAARLASEHEAQLIGACLVDTLVPPHVAETVDAFTLAGLFDGAMTVQLHERAKNAADELEVRFQATLRREELLGEWHALLGIDGRNLARLTRGADLVVLSQVGPLEGAPGPGWAMIEQVLFGSGRPTLFVPSAEPPSVFGESALIGWNGSREAARAVHDALPLLRYARAVTLLSVDAFGAMDGVRPSAEMAAHLARHGVPVTVAETESAGLSTADVLLDYAIDIGADMIVAGGNGDSQRREPRLEGTTLDLLRHATIPILLSH